MSKDFILPDIGEGIVECEVVEWFVQEGDTVVEDQPVCDVMTDKALVQIPAISDGVVTKLYYEKGEVAIVHEPLFAVSSVGEPLSESTPMQGVSEQIMDQTPVVSINNKATKTEDFLLPDIGEGIVECEVAEWLVEEGEEVLEDQAICEVMTDKALVQIPAKNDGIVSKLYYAKGDIAKVHEPLFAITSKVEGIAQVTSPHIASDEDTQTKSLASAVGSNTTTNPAISDTSNNTSNVTSITASTGKKKAVASPAVRRMAREMNLDITAVVGSGEKGRVFKQDLLSVGNSVNTVVQANTGVSGDMTASVAKAAASNTNTGSSRVEPIRGVKAAMAKAMQDSVSSIPHFTYSDEIDLTELIKLRKALKPKFEQDDIKLTMMPFFIKAMSLALKQFPIMNSQPNSDCTELTYLEDHNIGMAVDSKVGLLVPNIKGCQSKSIRDIAVDVMAITKSARDGRLAPEQLKNGTISISNIGAIGGTTATPIINKPEVAIVALGKMQTLPRFDESGNVVARQIMTVSWSGDHRVIDGGTIARFNNLWMSYLEEPSSMLTEMI
ncbi:dihydrolipoyllysine-residue acetyltransferase [Psychrosphaera sp. B3R10]|uniref:dihydrolipoyllysine-residue acetyltransferase n=1 Tax=unclassified Psychrosphaera TaxID=2641570 RepID=UPI001C085642|nr:MULTISPECIES: dihydrolipoyllysine-residue acetyltransferase [unclassified Psychrosphaera]MBU2882298.1 dihydrolipoyllysine-residue acetyltransferase [Psychrosphaera sp. I2R16]MBU2988979.1 dihydrolipoyllysine-residue acetyltransferase [Psychrosphaera sp. B3R10]